VCVCVCVCVCIYVYKCMYAFVGVLYLNTYMQTVMGLTQDWTTAELLRILDYQMVPVRTRVLAGNFLLLSLY